MKKKTPISTRIAGTVGYMAAEYTMRGYLTDKADAYSFRVVVPEIVSGMSNANYWPKEEFVYLLDWAYVLQEQENLPELCDESPGLNYSSEEALQMLNLALVCTNPSPTVVIMLESKTPVKVPTVNKTASKAVDARFKALEKLSHDSQSQSFSMDGPWTNSFVSSKREEFACTDKSYFY